MMTMTSLSMHPAGSESIPSEVRQTGVGVWTLQSWIQDAWNDGFDEQGKQDFKGELKGKKKWIGKF